ncbi:MAG: hypothetical protein ACQEWU_12750 [Bacillota bacterium]|uniref:hypothetical protein n=1 Tax=Virgibacillus TaxID=84406 RepID=UPI0003F5EBDC|nr:MULTISPECIES: hypothetical protein [Bacillaceae]MCC2251034.1 hypothetical protein [Virgibacillus sp. AGTR]QRZ17412.1 hypothetical protein JUJ52_16780 [Virgibacillus sp. AGTR]WBX79142.1 hypothetical protein PD280_15370 [Virgibacillus salarius]
MNKWHLVIMIITAACVIAVVYLIRLNSTPAITYFPIDNNTTFSKSETQLQLFSEKGKDNYEITWESDSITNMPIYLRQDVSLLYDNGRLKGAKTKWTQDTDTIQLREKLFHEDSSLFQSISFHHGEIHRSSNDIKSIHRMSSDYLYVIDSPTTALDSFKKPHNNYEKEWKDLLDRTTKQQLLYHWHQLFHYFHIDPDNYLSVPLTDLVHYNTKPLPSLTQAQTNKIIGQLWEGLYKNYVIPVVNTTNEELNSYIPIILFDKEQKHLLVLYEINGKKEKLIQNYSFQ